MSGRGICSAQFTSLPVDVSSSVHLAFGVQVAIQDQISLYVNMAGGEW
jgi:hypothetical protein